MNVENRFSANLGMWRISGTVCNLYMKEKHNFLF